MSKTERADDYTRLAQCILCWKDPEKCGCTEKDEDEKGLCNKFYGGKLYKSELAGGVNHEN